MIALFTYGFEVASKNFEDAKVKLCTLSNYENLIEQAAEANYISVEEKKTLQEWRNNPSEWNISL
jgi:orotate phosphoribosyltransferase